MNVQVEQAEQGSPLRSGDVARAAGVNAQTLRYYERRGVLPRPRRNDSGHRQYPPHTVTLLRMIKVAQGLGLSLEDIAVVLASDDAATTLEPIARRRVAEIDAQIAVLTASRDALVRSLR